MSNLFIAGHRGMVGRALVKEAARRGFDHVLVADRSQLDLCDAAAVRRFFAAEKPDIVIVAAARVGGILANQSSMADFFYENISIAVNVIRAAHECGVSRLLFLGSSCIYPREAPQPMTEASLLTGPLEPTNEGYALAKIGGLKFCQYLRRQHGRMYHSIMPTNLYGPGDNYDPLNSHVIPGMLRRMHEAREAGAPSITIWGTGSPRREFLFVEDLAEACFHLLSLPDPPDWVNAGTGHDLSIMELAQLLKEITGYNGDIKTDPSLPDGAPRKLLDVSLMKSLGWEARTNLRAGLAATYRAFQERLKSLPRPLFQNAETLKS